jgi:hypothetical protein
MVDDNFARQRREAAAAKYRPHSVRLLLIAEAPPSALDRYFYFADVRAQDSLFRHVARAVLGVEPSRSGKAAQLQQLADAGVFLIDLKTDPKSASESLERFVPDLVARALALEPDYVITIKANVCDLAQQPLRSAGLRVVNERVPFPGSGQQRRFLEAIGPSARGDRLARMTVRPVACARRPTLKERDGS